MWSWLLAQVGLLFRVWLGQLQSRGLVECCEVQDSRYEGMNMMIVCSRPTALLSTVEGPVYSGHTLASISSAWLIVMLLQLCTKAIRNLEW